MKKILGLAAVMVLAMSQVSFSAPTNTDAAVQRLVKVAKQRQAQQAKEAAKGVVEEEVIVVPVEETVETPGMSPEARQKAETARLQAKERAEKAREVARQRKTKTRDLRTQRRNMSESKMMDAEIQRIRKRVDQINGNIEKFHKTNEMLDQMEQRLDAIQDKMK